MRLRDEESLNDRAQRELDAVDRALAGRDVDTDLASWAELTELLAEERPVPAPGWSEELDRRVAAGFREEDGDSAWERLRQWVESARPMKALAPAGALAAVLVVAVVGVTSLETGGDDDSSVSSLSAPVESTTSSDSDAGAASPPSVAQDLGGAPPESGVASAGEAAAPDAATLVPEGETGGFARRGSGEIAPGRDKRQVDRDVNLELSTRPEDVRSTTDEAIAITRGAGGIVSSSQVSESGRQATANLELVIPTRELDATLDQLTALANVESLAETTEDITKPFVGAQDRLEDAEAQRAELLEALGNAETATEAEAIRLQLDDIRREISIAEAQFDNVARQARLAEVSLTITGDPGAEAKDDGRTIGDWLDDAVSVLRDVAGILLISAAILVPLGILAVLGWFAISWLRRRRREQALDR